MRTASEGYIQCGLGILALALCSAVLCPTSVPLGTRKVYAACHYYTRHGIRKFIDLIDLVYCPCLVEFHLGMTRVGLFHWEWILVSDSRYMQQLCRLQARGILVGQITRALLWPSVREFWYIILQHHLVPVHVVLMFRLLYLCLCSILRIDGIWFRYPSDRWPV